VPVGGTTGQVLTKINATDYNTNWQTPSVPAGSITTPMLAANAAQQLLGTWDGAATFSTTTTGTWQATPVSVSVTTGGGVIRIECAFSIYHSAANAGVYAGIYVDGVQLASNMVVNMPGNNSLLPISFVYYDTGRAAGAHTYALWLQNGNAGTLTLCNFNNSTLFITEQKR